MKSPHDQGPEDRATQSFIQLDGGRPGASTAELTSTLERDAPALKPLADGDLGLLHDIVEGIQRQVPEGAYAQLFSQHTSGLANGPELDRQLRRLRHRGVMRIALRETLRLADVAETSWEMAELASATVDAALSGVLRQLDATEGRPHDETGNAVPFTVLGMGKLGGGELNLGSDIDLIFFYETDAAQCASGLTAHEYFERAGAQATRALGEVTEDGFCFRVDLRLRPEGTRGPLANSLASAEHYYETFGRTWERAALVRARPIAGDKEFGRHLLWALRPFVYRRHVEPEIAAAMNRMLEASRRQLGRHADENIKLGRGGIREVEFFVQSLQLIWGGRFEELQTPGTLDALAKLRDAGLVSDGEAEQLEDAWTLLRRAEHRIHVRAGYQTHQLPPTGEERHRFAVSLGFADAESMQTRLQTCRDDVHALFESLLVEEHSTDPALEAICDRVAAHADEQELALALEATDLDLDTDEAVSNLMRLGRHAHAPLGPVGRKRHPALGPMILEELRRAANPDIALRQTAEFFSRLGGPWDYQRLFVERPRHLRRLMSLFGMSQTLSEALIAHPESLDALAFGGLPPEPAEIVAAHEEFDTLLEVEDFVAALRRHKRELTLLVGLAYTSGDLSLEQAETRLSALGRSQVSAALRFATRTTPSPTLPDDGRRLAVGPKQAMCVLGLGKLGAGELGFHSDLDLVFVYGATAPTTLPSAGTQPELTDTTHPQELAEHFTRIAQRTIHALAQPHVEGPGYSLDTRLRPGGRQGTLVVSRAAFQRYHEQNNQRVGQATWERQALIRARPVAGDQALGANLRALVDKLAFWAEPGEADAVAAMRRRMEQELAQERSRRYHPKLGYGALVDVELATQWLQMLHGKDPSLRVPRTVDALAALHARGHLDRATFDTLIEGHGFFRQVEQTLRLLDDRREPRLQVHGKLAARVARLLGFRGRDGEAPEDTLRRTWQERAENTRGAFERLVAPVGTDPPWKGR